ncbi:MAG: adenylyltransferase/cytidyltransferase family protein [Acidobacteria bacterium]|nr:adenylyltransferase/cytidyltransferase family protein [Acidobacteriota bacterium]
MRVGLMPGSFHPPTVAHLAVAEAALEHVDLVALVMPGEFPHKRYEGVTLEERLTMLAALAAGRRFTHFVPERGLFLEIAREATTRWPGARPVIICGRDAAERAETWRYDGVPPFGEQLREYDLLVAARGGEYRVPQGLDHAIRALTLQEDWSGVSSTAVRRRITAGERWEHLVPAPIHALVRQYYGGAIPPGRS